MYWPAPPLTGRRGSSSASPRDSARRRQPPGTTRVIGLLKRGLIPLNCVKTNAVSIQPQKNRRHRSKEKQRHEITIMGMQMVCVSLFSGADAWLIVFDEGFDMVPNAATQLPSSFGFGQGVMASRRKKYPGSPQTLPFAASSAVSEKW